ncbi:hypothetical protein AWJ19_33370 [Paenibacillus sp. DMB5]|nr:hypothetical protein AWJ19_33370 [Paenibacillus sp. DMB5]
MDCKLKLGQKSISSLRKIENKVEDDDLIENEGNWGYLTATRFLLLKVGIQIYKKVFVENKVLDWSL